MGYACYNGVVMNNEPINPPVNANPANNPAEEPDYDKPVAYDQQGRPLYARPPSAAPAAEQTSDGTSQSGDIPQSTTREFREQAEHRYVHVSRPIHPVAPNIPPEIMERYEQSRKRFPNLNLSKGEFVISAIKRHPIGLLQIWGAVVLLIVAMTGLVASYFLDGANADTVTLAFVGLGLMSLLVFLGGIVATYIYNANRFYLTNESVIQEIQIGLFNKHEQTVSLANIEDASYYQPNILSYLFDFGTIRLSTEGDETTYRFSYVAQPKRQIATLNNAVEDFKNGRPVQHI
jgi:hypothetical protein